MTTAIKAIETRYKNCRFRSRLEARWAVAFDVLQMPWSYEKEGFTLPSGSYLPDFWVPSGCPELLVEFPGAGTWYEIKAQEPTKRESRLAFELALHTNHTCVFLFGDGPWDFETRCVNRAGKWFGGKHEFGAAHMLDGLSPYHSDAGGGSRAVESARSARFEFGESG